MDIESYINWALYYSVGENNHYEISRFISVHKFSDEYAFGYIHSMPLKIKLLQRLEKLWNE